MKSTPARLGVETRFGWFWLHTRAYKAWNDSKLTPHHQGIQKVVQGDGGEEQRVSVKLEVGSV